MVKKRFSSKQNDFTQTRGCSRRLRENSKTERVKNVKEVKKGCTFCSNKYRCPDAFTDISELCDAYDHSTRICYDCKEYAEAHKKESGKESKNV